MIRASDGYEYETLSDILKGKKAQSRYNILYEDIEKLGGEEAASGFRQRYDVYLSVGYDPDRAADNAFWAPARIHRSASPGGPDRAGQAGAGQAPADHVHAADQPPV